MSEKPPSSTTTVRDIMDDFESRFGNVKSNEWSEDQHKIWGKLIQLGDRFAHLIHEVNDIDAAAELSAEEVAELRAEIEKL